MLRWTNEECWKGFGPSRFKSVRRCAKHGIHIHRLKRETRRLLRESCPTIPGVYGMIDDQGELVYVGKSKSLRHRLLSYFQASAADTKARCIVAHARQLVWEPAHHEFDALVRELELIRRWRPRFNVEGMPGRRQRAFLCIGRAPGAYAYLAPKIGSTALHAYGPVSAGKRMRRAVERLNNFCRLRDCPDRVPMLFADQLPLFDRPLDEKCLRYQFGTCLAPCAARCTSIEYAAAVRQARAFVEGTDPAALQTIEADMATAAEQRQFERAAALRDLLGDLRYLRYQIDRLHRIGKHECLIYALNDYRGRERWYVFRRGCPHVICASPTNAVRAEQCHALLASIEASAPHGSPEEQLSFMLLVAGWFRRRPDEYGRLLSIEAAREACARFMPKQARIA